MKLTNRILRARRGETFRALIIPALLSITTLMGSNAKADEPVTQAAIEAAIEDYVFARYEGDVETLRERSHDDIARRYVENTYWGQPSDEWVRPLTYEYLQLFGTQHNPAKLENPEDGRCDITIFDIEDRTAAAVVVMEDAVDYLHMIHFDGKWVIVDSALVRQDRNRGQTPDISTDETGTIAQIVRDYCMGFYEVDGDKVQDTCHPMLSKRVVEHNIPGIDFDLLRSITFEEIRILGETFNARREYNTESRCDVEVYEIRGNVAAAKLTGSVWFDYFQLLKVEDEWQIVNIMFEGLPEDEWTS